MDFRLFNKRAHRWLGLAVLPIGGLLLITGVALNHEKTWLDLRSGKVLSLATASADGSELLRGTARGLERSRDGGKTWSPIDTPWPMDEAVALVPHPLKPEIIYAALRWLGLIRSQDGGHVWESVPLPFQPEVSGVELKSLAVSPGGQLFLATSGGLLRSRDEGKTWDSITFSEHRQEPGLLIRSLHNAFFFGPWAIPLYDATAIAFGLLMISGIFLWKKTDVR